MAESPDRERLRRLSADDATARMHEPGRTTAVAPLAVRASAAVGRRTLAESWGRDVDAAAAGLEPAVAATDGSFYGQGRDRWAPVQRRSAGAAPDSGDPRAIGRQGTEDASDRLPHLDLIQRLFGRHDVSAVRARVGGAAADASRALGAVAYAQGEHVAFASSPDLRTAAHEAAHVVQQRHGVAISSGLDGGASDPHEQHADAVAELVVRGESAEALLDQHAGSSGGGGASGAVQRDTKGAQAAVVAPSNGAPALVKGAHAWPVLADGGKPYKIISAKDPVQFWTVSAWIRAGEGFHASGSKAVSPACAAEIITALGWVAPERVAAAAHHLVFDLHQEVTANEAAASAFYALGLPSAKPVVSRASADLVQVAARLTEQNVPSGAPIVPDENMRGDVVRALAAFTGLTPDADAVQTLGALPRFAKAPVENGVVLWDIDAATGNVLFGVDETAGAEPHRYARWLRGTHEHARSAPARAKLQLVNFYGRPVPATFAADHTVAEAGHPTWIGLDVAWPTEVPSPDTYEPVPMATRGHRNRPVALAQCEWTIVPEGGAAGTTVVTAATDLAELEHVFVLPAGLSRATFAVTVMASLPAYFEDVELSTTIDVKSTEALMSELRGEAFGDLAPEVETRTPETFDASGSGEDDHGLRTNGRLPASFKPTLPGAADPHAGARAANRVRLAATMMYLTTRGAPQAALDAVAKEIKRAADADQVLETEHDAGWQPFQIRGTYLSRDEDVPSGALVLYGSVHLSGPIVAMAVVEIRDLSRRFDNSDMKFTGTGRTFEAALKAAFTDQAKAYPAGMVAIDAEEIAVEVGGLLRTSVGGGTGKTIGFQLGTDSRWNRVKAKVWDPSVSFVINTAGMIAMGIFPPSAAVVAPLLAVYNSAGVADRMKTQQERGTLTLGMAATSVGEIALNILPMAGSAKVFTAGWFLLEGANWGGQAVLMSASALGVADDLQRSDVAALSQMYDQLQELEANTSTPPAQVEAARRALMARAELTSTRIEKAFNDQIAHNGLFALGGSVVHRAGALTGHERAGFVEELLAAVFAQDKEPVAKPGPDGGSPRDEEAAHGGSAQEPASRAAHEVPGSEFTGQARPGQQRAKLDPAVLIEHARGAATIMNMGSGAHAFHEIGDGRLLITVPGAKNIRVTFELMPARSDVANHDFKVGDTDAIVRISEQARLEDVTRAIAHELAEIQGLASGAPSGAPAMRPGSEGTELTHHDLGRRAEVEILLYQLDNVSPAARTDVVHELTALLEHLGFDAKTIGSDRRAQRVLGERAVARIDEILNKPRIVGKLDTDLITSGITNGIWKCVVSVRIPNGDARMVIEAFAPVDALGQPNGELEFNLSNEVRVDSRTQRVKVQDEGRLTDLAIRAVSDRYRGTFGSDPDNLDGSLAFDNKALFQRAYAEIVHASPKIAPEVAALAAIKRTPFGEARVRAKYDQFEVRTAGTESIVIGDPPRVQEVPANITVNARRKKS